MSSFHTLPYQGGQITNIQIKGLLLLVKENNILQSLSLPALRLSSLPKEEIFFFSWNPLLTEKCHHRDALQFR